MFRNAQHLLAQLNAAAAGATQVNECQIKIEKHLEEYTGCFFFTGTPLTVPSTKKLIYARLGVSRPIYVNVDSPNLGFPYFNFLGGYQLKKHPV